MKTLSEIADKAVELFEALGEVYTYNGSLTERMKVYEDFRMFEDIYVALMRQRFALERLRLDEEDRRFGQPHYGHDER